jgi:CelD/BcsL family acetyltransferase involved in cellulose biosynthesis
MVYRIDPISDPRWQLFVDDHPTARIFHTTGWVEALRRTYGYEPVVYTTTPPEQKLTNGLLFCRVRSLLTGHRLVSLPFSDHCQPLVRSSEELHDLLAAARQDCLKEKCRYVEIKPLFQCAPETVRELQLTVSQDSVIHHLDLRRSREEIVLGFHKNSIRRTIARSDREHLSYEEGTSEELLQKFYRLLLLTRRRHLVPPQPLRWFRNLIACLGDRLKIRIASLKSGRAVAGVLTLSYKTVVTYKYACGDSQFNVLGGPVMLIWRTIEDAMNQGACELDLGRSDIDTPGLITFKDHWGAVQSGISYYRYPAAPRRRITNGLAAATARRLVAAVPDSVFVAIGELFYKHAA